MKKWVIGGIVVFLGLMLAIVATVGMFMLQKMSMAGLNQATGKSAVGGPPEVPGLDVTKDWKAPAEPIRHVLLVLPPRWEDSLTDMPPWNMMRIHENLLFRGWPRDLELVSTEEVGALLAEATVYREDGQYVSTASFDAELTNLFKPTHTLLYFLKKDGDSVHVTITLQQGSDVRTKEVTVPGDFLADAASQGVRWVLEAGGITSDPVLLAKHDTLPGGEPIWRTSREEELQALWAAPGDEAKWAPLNPTVTGDPLLFSFRCRAVLTAKDPVTAARLDPGLLPDSAHPAVMLGRAKLLMAQDKMGEAATQYRQLIANYPGAMRPAMELFSDLKRPQIQAIATLDLAQWTQRVPDTPYIQFIRGNIHQNAAWEYRGGGYASTVTQDGWAGYYAHMPESESAYKSVIDTGTTLPSITAAYCRVLGQGSSESSKEEMLALHERTVSAWPDSVMTWYKTSFYLLPRWGGAPGEGTAFVGRALNDRPDNGQLIRVLNEYHQREAASLFSEDFFSLYRYLERDPVAARQYDTVLNRVIQPGIREKDRSYAITVAAGLHRADIVHAIVRLHPGIWRFVMDHGSFTYGTHGFRITTLALAQQGRWEELQKALDHIEPIDAEKRARGERCGFISFCVPSEMEALKALARVGNHKDPAALADLRRLRGEVGYYAVYTGVAAYLMGDVRQEDVDAVAALLKDKTAANRIEYQDVAALLQAHRGVREAAETYLSQAKAGPTQGWEVSCFPWAREEAERLLAKPR